MNGESYLCSVCGSSFSAFLRLKKHVEVEHPDNLDELVLQHKAGSRNVFSCHICSRKFRHKRFLRRHLNTNDHGIKVEESSLNSRPMDEEADAQQGDDHSYMYTVIKFEKDEFVDETDFVCGDCGGIFSTLFNLRKHVRLKHPDLLDTLAPRKKMGKFTCEECGKKFSHLNSLARHKIGKHRSSELKECQECGKPFLNLINFHKHMKNKHPESMATLVLQGIKSGEFSCDECGKVFSQRKNLRRHVTDKHSDASSYYAGKPVAVYQCPLCPFNKSGDVSLILNHFKNEHNIDVVMKALDFDSKELFSKWKEEMEFSTKSSYIKKAHVGSTSYFRCHRSGKYRPRGRGVRNLKTQGTNKIGGFCPAGMQVRVKDGKYSVKYSDTHVGHTNDLKHLKLSIRERQCLASEISAQVPLDDILTNVRKSAGSSEQELERLSLVTKQDLTNIMRAYQLENTAVRRSAVADSLDSWLFTSKKNVLYYKPQNYPDEEESDLYPHDFVLIIMTEAQKEILTRYGGGCVCLDRTDASMNRLHLSTIMVVDGLRSGFPVAFLISNRTDNEMLGFFFSTVKHVVGDINPGLLLTDVAEDYYTAWVRVMGEPGQTFFSLWQVERDWRENLSSLGDEASVTQMLMNYRALMTENDQATFHQGLNVAISLLADADAFTQYFIANYSENYHYWSKAYRSQDALSVDANLERLHFSIRYLYTEVKRNQRLDRTIDSILQFIDNKLFERATNLDKGFVKKNKSIIACHRASKSLNVQNILKINNSWHICPLNKHPDYRVDESNPDCNCDLKCEACNVCIHRFTCTCPDSVLKLSMCRHIHLVCQFLGTNGSNDEKLSDDEETEPIPSGYIGEIVIVETDDFKPDVYNEDLKNELSDRDHSRTGEDTNGSHTLDEKKDMIASLSNEIIQSISSVDEGDAFIQILKAVKKPLPSPISNNSKEVYITDNPDYSEDVTVKRVLYTVPNIDSSNPDSNSCPGNAIEAHITLDSDGITLLSQAANFASTPN